MSPVRVRDGLRRATARPLAERRPAVFCTAAILELAVAAPFLAIAPSHLRGVPGPLLIVICIGAAFLLGPVPGAVLAILGVSLGVGVLDEHPVGEPLVWIPAAVAAGLIGDQVRRGDQLRRELLDELRASLVALPGMPAAANFRIASRYVPAEGRRCWPPISTASSTSPEGRSRSWSATSPVTDRPRPRRPPACAPPGAASRWRAWACPRRCGR